MPSFIKFLIFHAVAGFAFAIFVVLVLLAFDVAHLRSLLMASDQKWIALFVLTFFMGLTFGSVQMGIAIMRMGKDDDDDDDKGGRGPKIAATDYPSHPDLIRIPIPTRGR